MVANRKALVIVPNIEKFRPYLALANVRYLLGHRGHEKWPFCSEIGTTVMQLAPASGFGRDGTTEELGTGVGPWLEGELVVDCEMRDTEVWFQLSSSSKELETEGPSEFGVDMELFRTTPPSAT
jgi:hypothetical protein